MSHHYFTLLLWGGEAHGTFPTSIIWSFFLIKLSFSCFKFNSIYIIKGVLYMYIVIEYIYHWYALSWGSLNFAVIKAGQPLPPHLQKVSCKLLYFKNHHPRSSTDNAYYNAFIILLHTHTNRLELSWGCHTVFSSSRSSPWLASRSHRNRHFT